MTTTDLSKWLAHWSKERIFFFSWYWVPYRHIDHNIISCVNSLVKKLLKEIDFQWLTRACNQLLKARVVEENADFLKANSFAHSEFSDQQFCAKTCAKNAIKTWKLFFKLLQKYEISASFPVLGSLIQILPRFSDILCNCAIVWSQLLETLGKL